MWYTGKSQGTLEWQGGPIPPYTCKVLLKFHGNTNEEGVGSPASFQNEHGYCQPNGELDGVQEMYPVPMLGPKQFFYKPI